MTYDADLLIARAHGHIILLEHCLRQTHEACDKTTARMLYNQIEILATNARKTVKHLELPERWQYFCRCGFEGKPNTAIRPTCPECGESLVRRDLTKGYLRDLDCKTP